VEIAGVPEYITRQQIVDVLASLGIDAEDITRDWGVTINGNGVRAEVFARNAEGKRYVPPGADDCAKHLITIPIKD
jgi:hypothetical protein